MEGVLFRGSGQPSSPWASGLLAREDLNGATLVELTPELAKHHNLTVNAPWLLPGLHCFQCGGSIDDPCGCCQKCGAAPDQFCDHEGER